MVPPRRAMPAFAPDLARLLAQIEAALQCEAYLVGGFVRDTLLGRDAVDIDVAVAGDAAAAADRVAACLGGSAFALAEEREQYRVLLPAAGRYLDIGALRGPVTEDMTLRDFTVDAMAAPLLAGGRAGDLIDPTGGLEDLDQRLLRAVSERAFRDDPLRLLRGVRLATELEFEFEPSTRERIASERALLRQAAPERQRDEVVRILKTPRAASGLRLLDSRGLLEVLLPELTAARGVSQPREHFWDVFDHSLETVGVLDALLTAGHGGVYAGLAGAFRGLLSRYPLDDYFSRMLGGHPYLALTKLAGLLHDVAKPETKAPDASGRVRFLGHAEAGAVTTRRICRRLRFGARETAFVATLVEEHLRPTQLSAGGPPSSRAIFRFFRDLDEAAPACLVLSLADAAAAAGPRLTGERWRGHVSYIAHVLERWEEQARALPSRHMLGGGTIMTELGVGPGPLVGRLQRAIDEAAAAGEVASEEEALALARELYVAWRQEPASAESGRS